MYRYAVAAFVGVLFIAACSEPAEEGRIEKITKHDDGGCTIVIDGGGEFGSSDGTHRISDERFCGVARVGDSAEVDDGHPELGFGAGDDD